MDPCHGQFLVKMYVKMKELGPVGGGVRPARPPPSRSANGAYGDRVTLLEVIQDIV